MVDDAPAGAPAAGAGLRAGDLILRIDGASTRGMNLQAFTALSTGPVGVSVTLHLEHGDGERAVEITRARLD